ncbi:DUF1214 domain-containing protein [uncultured Vibrio sp.]|uniref:DUF1214 domain-containing protein n=1 Tax=uncultured Vibrio sp. TaxID=114054 RepID=UPI0025CE0F3E|nr:DUF1214 domain-containing protein [uncultured Vibrio sp.]
MKSKTFKLTLTASLLAMMSTAGVASQQYPVESNVNDPFVTVVPSGKLDLGNVVELDDKGYPTLDGINTLYEEMDYQGAVSAYLQTIPQMALYGSRKTNHYYGATGETDVLLMYKDPSVDGMLTPNRVVEYHFSYPNLAETGPLILELPAGEIASIVLDMQMRWHADGGVTSASMGKKPTKYLIMTVDQEVPDDVNLDFNEYEVIKIRTNQFFFAGRNLNPVKNPGILKDIRLYPYAERNNPPETKFVQAKSTDDTYYMAQPIGMAYWEQLHEYIQQERIDEADRYMMARLKNVGIEKGKPFNPTEKQKEILERAAVVGEKMAIATSFSARTDSAFYRDDSRWVHPLTLNPSHRNGETYAFEERTDWTYEAYGISQAMKAGQPGEGSTYLAAYQDEAGKWFEGSNEYVFRVAPDAPAARFWDLSTYKLETRSLLPDVPGFTSAINTYTEGLKKEEDGSILIYFGPNEAPEGYENNFIKTYEDQRWFTYFRLYGPTDTYFDRSYKMYDIVEIK